MPLASRSAKATAVKPDALSLVETLRLDSLAGLIQSFAALVAVATRNTTVNPVFSVIRVRFVTLIVEAPTDESPSRNNPAGAPSVNAQSRARKTFPLSLKCAK
jgi:hypothetical protein